MDKVLLWLGKLEAFWYAAQPKLQKAWKFTKEVFRWVYKLRSIVLAVPVALGAVYLAMHNMAVLPNRVGINLLPDGSFSFTIGVGVAVMAPLAITALCLLLMFCSKKTTFPWLVSLFSLALPVLIGVTNVFPA